MKKYKSYRKSEKRFLNKSGFHSIAAIGYNFEIGGSNSSPYTYGSMYISDCHRVITLDCTFSTMKEYENAVCKLLTLKEVSEQALNDLLELRNKFVKLERKSRSKKGKGS